MTTVYVRRGGNGTGNANIVLDSVKNLLTGEAKFKSEFGGVSTLESDLLLIASAVYAADRCIKRGEREDATREIEVSIPVVNIGVSQPLVPTIEKILRRLSSDSWEITLRQEPGALEEKQSFPQKAGATLLFSGGLDSFSAALDLGKVHKAGLHLVSHLTHNQPTTLAQTQLVALLSQHLGTAFPHHKFLVSSKAVAPGANLKFDAESSQRTRSFLFLVLAALSARRAGHNQIIVIAENGQMAIHLPITEARIGPFSTRTAHPEVLRLIESFLNAVLGTSFTISNPFLDKTKAEIVAPLVSTLPSAIPLTSSCWKNARLPKPATHCGFCIPCIIRRIAIERHCTDTTAYGRNLFAEPFSSLLDSDDGRRNLADYAEFVQRIEDTVDSEAVIDWPELSTPPIVPLNALAMYRRAANEARTVLAKYPGLAPLLQ